MMSRTTSSNSQKNMGIMSLKHSKKFMGVVMMLLHALAFSVIYNIKKVITLDLHPTQIAFLYKLFVLLMVLPWCFIGGIKKNLSTTKIGIHASRGAFSIMGTVCFLYGIKYIPATDAAAITFLEGVIIVLIGVFYFKEKFNYSKLLLVLLGVLGAFLIIQPGFRVFNGKYVFLFLALMFWTFNNISIKVLGKTERSRAQIFYVTLFSCLLTLPLAIANWVPMQLIHFKYLFFIALLYLVHLVAIFKAFKFADFSIVMPFDYTRLVFTGILSYIFLDEFPDMFKIMGYAAIIFGGLIMLEYESRQYRRRKKKLQDELVSVVSPPISNQ